MLRFGKINSADPTTGRYRVLFEDDNLVTAPLPVGTRNSLGNKTEDPLDVGQPVACLMDENCEEGIIIDSYNDKDNLPAFANKDQSGITYKDGTFIKYDRDAKKYTASFEGDVEIIKSSNIKVACSGVIEFNGGSNDGLVKINDLITKLNNLENAYNDLAAKFNSHVHVLTLTAGTGTAAPTVLPETTILTPTVKPDIENPDITQ